MGRSQHNCIYSNCSPTKVVRDKTLFEAWHKQKPMVNQLIVFGCIAYTHIPSQERENFDEKGETLSSLAILMTLRDFAF